jgi:hypothetical protein
VIVISGWDVKASGFRRSKQSMPVCLGRGGKFSRLNTVLEACIASINGCPTAIDALATIIKIIAEDLWPRLSEEDRRKVSYVISLSYPRPTTA